MFVRLLGHTPSCAAGLPDTAGLQTAVREILEEKDRGVYDRVLTGRDIEKGLTQLRLIAETLRGTEVEVDGLTSAGATAMDQNICSAIARVIAAKSTESKAHDDWARGLCERVRTSRWRSSRRTTTFS